MELQLTIKVREESPGMWIAICKEYYVVGQGKSYLEALTNIGITLAGEDELEDSRGKGISRLPATPSTAYYGFVG